MRLMLVVIHISLVATQMWVSAHYRDEVEDNEFAEFEDFQDDDDKIVVEDIGQGRPLKPLSANIIDDNGEQEDEDEDAIVEDDDNEFDHFQDEEEFEGYDNDRLGTGNKVDDKEVPKITITKVCL
ncbi:coiled-coil domain-containing protein 47-like [Nilaparvata lugens]|uniref:coiled-coil domain-containing protein 47-like n=1 Tax=Nilaparvata lugens TaxID=108931 RepID=UPI00193C8BA6|nr:coiled-coil domain-containing protein 47-like [Nilaparvata lugens]